MQCRRWYRPSVDRTATLERWGWPPFLWRTPFVVVMVLAQVEQLNSNRGDGTAAAFLSAVRQSSPHEPVAYTCLDEHIIRDVDAGA